MDKKYLLSLFALIPVLIIVQLNDGIGISEQFNVQSSNDETTVKHALQGYVTAVHRDPDGNIKGYYSSDNAVVNTGENCSALMLFGSAGGLSTGNSVCTGAITVGFRYIGLEEGSTAVAEDDNDLENPADESGLATPLWSTITWTNSTGTSSEVTAVMVATFTNAGSSETITGSALFNATSLDTRGMYAHALFSSSAVIDTSDTLEVTWTVYNGGGTVP